MIKLFSKIPRVWKLVVEGLFLLLVLYILWASLDYPSMTANSAFRRSVIDAAYPSAELELLLGPSKLYPDRYTALGTNDQYAFLVYLENKHGWKKAENIRNSYEPQSFETGIQSFDVAHMQGELSCLPLRYYPLDERNRDYGCFAVRTSAASASLTLVFDERDFSDNSETTNPPHTGTISLLIDHKQDNWVFFCFPNEYFEWFEKVYIYNYTMGRERSDIDNYYDTQYVSFFRWFSGYSSDSPSAHLELTTFDDDGNVITTAVFPL